jgi:hypothetical protein
LRVAVTIVRHHPVRITELGAQGGSEGLAEILQADLKPFYLDQIVARKDIRRQDEVDTVLLGYVAGDEA